MPAWARRRHWPTAIARQPAARRRRRRQLGVALREAAVVAGEPREAPHLAAGRRRRSLDPLDDGAHLARVRRHALCRVCSRGSRAPGGSWRPRSHLELLVSSSGGSWGWGRGPAAGSPAKARPTVRAAKVMTRVSSEEALCRPNGTSLRSNRRRCDRRRVFHKSAARTRCHPHGPAAGDGCWPDRAR